jgi:voltage-gated potassium channel
LRTGMREFLGWLARLFRQPIFVFVTLWGHGVILLAALVFQSAEKGANPNVSSFFHSYYWAISTATTVGSTDLAPVTFVGKAVAILLMVFGALFLWSYTALFAASFVAPTVSRMGREVEAEVEKVEREVRVDQATVQRLAEQVEEIHRILGKR